MSKSPRNWWTLNAKVLSFRYFLQNWIIFNTFGATLSWNVTVEMKHTVGQSWGKKITAHINGNKEKKEGKKEGKDNKEKKTKENKGKKRI